MSNFFFFFFFIIIIIIIGKNTETEQGPIRGSGAREADILSGGPWPLRLCSDG